MRRVPDQYSIVLPSPAAHSVAVFSNNSRMEPSTRYLRFVNSASESRIRELLPSAATTRSALRLVPSARISSPSGVAPMAGELVTISTAASCAAAAAFPVVNGDQPAALVAHFAGMRKRRALNGSGIGAYRFENAQAVLVDVNAGARCAQALGALVHANAPAALRQSAGRGEPGKSSTGDLGVAPSHPAASERPVCRSVRLLAPSGDGDKPVAYHLT